MNCIIVEDELPAQKLLLNYLERTAGCTCLGTYGAISGLPLELLNKTDLILLDIQLPEINGLDFLSSLVNKPAVIITSAYREYAIDAFEEAVTDFLLKPFSYQRFLKAILRVRQAPIPTHVDELRDDSFFVYTNKTFQKVERSKIKYISAEVDYVKIHTESGELLINDSLNHWVSKLRNHDFVRVHRSYLVNFKYIEGVQGNTILLGKVRIPIGKTYRDEFFSLIKQK